MHPIRSVVSKLILTVYLSSFAVSQTHAWELTWYGQSAVKILTPGNKSILIDPFISKNPKTPIALKDLKKLGSVDLILVTHGHGDHFGDTVAIVEMTGAKVALNADMGHTYASLGMLEYSDMIRFNKSGPIQPLPNITITMVRAEHSSIVLHKDNKSDSKSVHSGGEPVGYIIRLENGYTIYHAGDTGVFSDMKLIAELYEPDLSLLPIGGHYTMDPKHAAYAVKNLLKPRSVIPIHYGTFPPLKGTPKQFIDAIGDFNTQVMVLNPGDKKSFKN